MYSGASFEDVQVLTGHEGAVQAVLVLPNGDFLTGGNDTTIKLWSDNKCEHTFRGHTDTVRYLNFPTTQTPIPSQNCPADCQP